MAEVVRRHEGPSPKSLDSDENFKPQHTIFCLNIKICRDLRTPVAPNGLQTSEMDTNQSGAIDGIILGPFQLPLIHLGASGGL